MEIYFGRNEKTAGGFEVKGMEMIFNFLCQF